MSAKYGTNVVDSVETLFNILIDRFCPSILVPELLEKIEPVMPLYTPPANENLRQSWISSLWPKPSIDNSESSCNAANQFALEILLRKTLADIPASSTEGPCKSNTGDGAKLCPWGCGKLIKNYASNSAMHFESECSNRFITCKLGCGARMRMREIRTHMQELCPNRVIPCLVEGCEMVVKASLFKLHESEYLTKPVLKWTKEDAAHWVDKVTNSSAVLESKVDGKTLQRFLDLGREEKETISRVFRIRSQNKDLAGVYKCLETSLQNHQTTHELDDPAPKSTEHIPEKKRIVTNREKRDGPSGMKRTAQEDPGTVKSRSYQNASEDGKQRSNYSSDAVFDQGVVPPRLKIGHNKRTPSELLTSIKQFKLERLITSNAEYEKEAGTNLKVPKLESSNLKHINSRMTGSNNRTRPETESTSISKNPRILTFGENIKAFDRTRLKAVTKSTASERNNGNHTQTKLVNQIQSFDVSRLKRKSTSPEKKTSNERVLQANSGTLDQSLANRIVGFDRSKLKKVIRDETNPASSKAHQSFKPKWANELEKALDSRRQVIEESSSDSESESFED